MSGENLAVLVPVFNDWICCGQLIRNLDRDLADVEGGIDVFLLDDGSTSTPQELGLPPSLQKIDAVKVLRLRRNLGHQRAICIGLSFVEAEQAHARVLVMDSDGEDRPTDARRLLAAADGAPGRVVFARRARRTEGLVFRTGYAIYRALHRALTGHDIHFGNFSVVPRAQLRSITVASELWNHFAGSVLVTRVPYTAIDTDRGIRYGGTSSMSLQSLAIHGLSAIAVFSSIAATRLIVASAVLAGLATAAILTVVAVRLSTDLGIPGWATNTAGILLLVFMQSMLSILTFLFLILGARSQATFIPSRDYRHFIDSLTTVWGHPGK